MLKEVCITPQVFDIDHINFANSCDIKTMLNGLAHSGYILMLNNKEWNKEVINNINKLEQGIREMVTPAISRMKDRQRIVGHPKDVNTSPVTEEEWLKIALELNNIRPFYKIIATNKFNDLITSVDQLSGVDVFEEWGILGSIRFLQTIENIHDILLPVLSYAKKVTVIDPFFNLSRPGFKRTLEEIVASFRERRGKNERGTIIVHTRWKGLEPVDIVRWQAVLKKIQEKSHHFIQINAWEQWDIKLHERYIITNQCGIISGAGLALDDYQQSEWSIKKYEEKDDVLSDYRENSSPYKLKCVFSASSPIEYK